MQNGWQAQARAVASNQSPRSSPRRLLKLTVLLTPSFVARFSKSLMNLTQTVAFFSQRCYHRDRPRFYPTGVVRQSRWIRGEPGTLFFLPPSLHPRSSVSSALSDAWAFVHEQVNGLDRSWKRPPGLAAKLIDSKARNGNPSLSLSTLLQRWFHSSLLHDQGCTTSSTRCRIREKGRGT